MAYMCRSTCLLFLLSLFSCVSDYRSPVDINLKPESVHREFKTLTLPNGLRAMLISDPDVKMASAAINVNVGFGEDPKGQEGMAHFLEHMLFLGTKKYPKESDYNEYMGRNQGSNNAYTTFDNTNYFFEINPPALPGAVDRFSQFFIAPLFNPKFVQREKQAVNNEFEKNKLNDQWRSYEISKKDYLANHPMTKFGTGNQKTLSSITQEDLVAWYKTYYSANVMTLALVGPQSLKDLEHLAQEYFSKIPNRKLSPPTYSSKILDPAKSPRLTHIQPIKDQKSLEISFLLPPQVEFYQDKSYRTIAALMGSEHKGGLAHHLKEQGLISSLYGYADSQDHLLQMTVNMKLTEKGLQSHQVVLQEVLAYINFLKTQAFPKSFFYEQKAVSEIYYVYPRFQEGGSYAAGMASLLQTYGDDALKKAQLFHEPSPDRYFSLLNRMTIKNAQIQLIHKDFKPSKTEAIYGIKFHQEPLKLASSASRKTASTFTLPPPNPYIPEDLSLLHDDNSKARILVKSQGMEFWFQPDHQIKLPRANLTGRLVSEEPGRSKRDYVIHQIYGRLLNHYLADWSEQLSSGGINFSLSPIYYGLSFSFDGFSDKIPAAFSAFLGSLRQVALEEKVFSDKKINYLRDIKNTAYSSAYKLALTKLGSEMNRYTPFPPKLESIAKTIKFTELKAYHQKFKKQFLVQAVAYGNLEESKLKDIVSKQAQQSSPVNTAFLSRAYPVPAKPQSFRVKTKDNNDAWTAVKMVGKRDPRNEAFASLLDTFISDRYFNELRTNQQLGYIVATFPYRDPKNLGIQFLIQSSKYQGSELAKRSRSWFRKEAKQLNALSQEDFLKVKGGLISKLEKPFKTSADYAEQLYQEIFIIRTNGYRQRLIEELKKMDLKSFKTMSRSFMNKAVDDRSVFVAKIQKS